MNFDEDDFIVPGPGALEGMTKCFGYRPTERAASQIIRQLVKDQEAWFDVYGLKPVRLMGERRLHAIDCQNLFCEIDKYSRVRHPQFNLQRTAIKQKLKPTGSLAAPFFPPKWNLN